MEKVINIPIQYYFLNQLTEYNAVFGQQQIENIIKTMALIERRNYHREYLSTSGFYLPSGIGIKNYEIDHVAKTLIKILQNI